MPRIQHKWGGMPRCEAAAMVAKPTVTWSKYSGYVAKPIRRIALTPFRLILVWKYAFHFSEFNKNAIEKNQMAKGIQLDMGVSMYAPACCDILLI